MMTHRLTAVLFALPFVFLLDVSADEKKNPQPLAFKLERLDPALDKFIAPNARFEELANGFAWTEGPVWVPEGKGYLLFSDIPNNRVVKWEEGKGTSDFLKPVYAGARTDLREPGSNGLLLDAEVPLASLSIRVVDELDRLEPYGVGNPKPLLVATQLEVVGQPRVVGEQKNHLQLRVRQGDVIMKAIGWNLAERGKALVPGIPCSLVFQPTINEWNNRRDVQLEIKDFAIS